MRTVLFNADIDNVEITDVTKAFPDSMFAVPAGFQKVDMMGAAGVAAVEKDSSVPVRVPVSFGRGAWQGAR